MFRARGIRRNIRQADVRFHGGRKFNFGFFGRVFQALLGLHVFAQINPFLLAEFVRHPRDDGVIHIRTAQFGIAGGGQHVKGAFFTHFHNGHIQGTAAQVKHQDFLFFAGFINTKGQSGGRRFVYQADYIQPGNTAGVFGGLALVIVKISRYGDDRFFYRFAQKGFGIFFNFLQHKGGKLLRGKFLPAQVKFEIFTHAAFERGDGAFRVCNSLAAGRFTHQTLAVFCKSYIRRKRFAPNRVAFCRRNNSPAAAFHYRRGGVRCTQVNTNNLSHTYISPYYLLNFLLCAFLADDYPCRA